MKQRERVTKSKKNLQPGTKAAGPRARGKTTLSLMASVEESKRPAVSMREMMEFYKPIKKPVTLRLDADVLAWFRRDGRLYQTRINGALRKVMERETKEAGE
jgi:uncharacterized protein (DUF4415 family)